MISEMKREQLYPWVGSMIIAALVWFFAGLATYNTAVSRLVDPITTVSTLAIGFLLAVTTMLISMERQATIQELKGIGAYNVLLGYLRSSTYVWFVVAGFSIVTVLIEPQTIVPLVKAPWFRISSTIWAFLLALGFLTSFRVARIIFALLRYGSGSTEHRLSSRENEPGPHPPVRHAGSRT